MAQYVEFDGDDDDDDPDSASPEEELLAAAADALPALARALGPHAFAPVFAERHLQPLLQRMKAPQVRRAAGCADVLRRMLLSARLDSLAGSTVCGNVRESVCGLCVPPLHAVQHICPGGASKNLVVVSCMIACWVPRQVTGVRAIAAGAAADVIKELGPCSEPFVEPLLPPLMRIVRCAGQNGGLSSAFLT